MVDQGSKHLTTVTYYCYNYCCFVAVPSGPSFNSATTSSVAAGTIVLLLLLLQLLLLLLLLVLLNCYLQLLLLLLLENVDNFEIFQSAGFIWFVCQYVCKRSRVSLSA